VLDAPPVARVALGWGCGIGSILALDALQREKHDVVLVRVVPVPGSTRDVPDFVVQEQAACLGLPLRIEQAVGEGETAALERALAVVRADAIAFGYLRGEDYLGLFKVASSTRRVGAEPLLPVRHLRPDDAAHRMVESGHRAFVRATRDDAERAWLGRFLDAPVIDEIEGTLGRSGWSLLRSLVVDGPLFQRRLDAVAADAVRASDGWRLGLSLKG